MGGEGSGRKPDPFKALLKSSQPNNPNVVSNMVLPNLSGVKHEIEAGTTNILGTTFSNFVPYNGANQTVFLNTQQINFSDSTQPGTPWFLWDYRGMEFGQNISDTTKATTMNYTNGEFSIITDLNESCNIRLKTTNAIGDKSGDIILDTTTIEDLPGNVIFPAYTTDGFLKTSSSNGTIVIDTTSYVPYTGATTDLNLGDYFLLAEGVKSHDSHGFYFKTQAGADSASYGLGGGTGWTFYDGVKLNTAVSGAVVFTDANSNLATSGVFVWNNTLGRLGIGTSSPEMPLDFATTSSTNPAIQLTRYTNDANSARLVQRKSRGTEVNSGVIVAQGDSIATFIAQGHDGVTWQTAGQILFAVDGAPAASDMPGRISFWTTADGGTSLLERMRIKNNGWIGIGTTAPGRVLDINHSAGQCVRLTYNDADGSAANYTDLNVTSSGALILHPSASQYSALANHITASGALTILGQTTASGAVTIKGDTTFVGSGVGLPYASCYGNEIAWTQTGAVQDTWYQISDLDITSGALNLATHASGALTLAATGVYYVTINTALESSLANQHIQLGAKLNSTVQGALNHIEARAVGVQMPIGLNLLVTANANDVLSAVVRTTDAGTPDISADHLTITAVHIGG